LPDGEPGEGGAGGVDITLDGLFAIGGRGLFARVVTSGIFGALALAFAFTSGSGRGLVVGALGEDLGLEGGFLGLLFGGQGAALGEKSGETGEFGGGEFFHGRGGNATGPLSNSRRIRRG